MTKTKILIAIDDPDWASIIVHHLFNIIDKENSELVLLNVLETTLAEEEVFYANPEGFLKTEARKANFAKIENFLEENKFNYEFVYKEGNAAEKILELSKELDADIIVLGSHNKHFLEKLFLGSVAYKVSRRSKCSVMIISQKTQVDVVEYKKFNVLLAVDGSEAAYYAAETLHKLIDTKRANVEILNVMIPPQSVIPPEAYIYTNIDKIVEEAGFVSEEILDIAAEKLQENEIYQVKKHSICGDICSTIIDFSENNFIDLIVMGEHGKKDLSERILGSISAIVSDKAKVPVLLIKKNNLPQTQIKLEAKFTDKITKTVGGFCCN